MFEEKFVSFSPAPALLNLVGLPIVVDKSDFPGIHIAAQTLAEDFARVTKGPPSQIQFIPFERDGFSVEAPACIIVGSIEKSPLLQRLGKHGKVGLSNIRGKWESYTTAVVNYPFEGCRKALVIAGSDKRGAIFGVYSLSEQIGVSPYDFS
jgi:hypothetical protein